MYKALSPFVLEEMEERGDISITIKPGWEQTGGWAAKPARIIYNIGPQSERIFTCYFSRDNGLLQITNVEATKLISNNKALIDAYIYVALKGLIEFSNNLGAKQLLFDSFISAAADHMLDLGFSVTSRGSSGGLRGCKLLKD